MPNPDQTIDEIRLRMHLLRNEIDLNCGMINSELQTIKTNVSNAVNFKYQVAKRPWLWSGLALAVGYFLIPKKQSAVENNLAQLRKVIEELQRSAGINLGSFAPNQQTMFGRFFKTIAGYGTRFATNYIQQAFVAYLANLAQKNGANNASAATNDDEEFGHAGEDADDESHYHVKPH